MRTRTSIACATLLLVIFSAFACRQSSTTPLQSTHVRPLGAEASPALKSVVEAALEQTRYTRYYDQSYTKISYPGGDVPLERGACTDVIIRAFRSGGVDLQKEVHEDMEQHFAAYPAKWGLKSPDPNIDHRRVPNLRTFFERKGKSLPITNRAEDYLPGDVVTWDLGGGADHTGVVTNLWSDETQNYLIVHNMGGGAKVENVLFAWRITGHYRYF
jgi:uncharacterized protein